LLKRGARVKRPLLMALPVENGVLACHAVERARPAI